MRTTRNDVLFIAYDFSTKIMGGSIRAIKMAEYLPRHGWTPHVLTASPPAEHPALPSGTITFIPSPERGFGGGIAVGDDGASTLGGNPRWLNRLAPLKRVAPLERQLTWLPRFRRDALRAAAGRPVRAVMSTSAPYVVMLFGHWLARRLGVPHVVDLRDDWLGREQFEDRSWLNRKLLDACCTYAVRRAAAVSVVSWHTRPRFEAMGVPVHLITNGYDEPAFAHIPMVPAPAAAPDGPLRILHLGWMGAYRSVGPVLEALTRLRHRAPDLAGQIRLEQYGLIEPSERRLIAASAVADQVAIRSQVPHDRAVALMAGADVLLAMPGTNIPAALTGKLFEYLRARRPVLLWAGPGAAMELAEQVGLRWRIREGDVEALAAALAALVENKRQGRLRTAANPALLPPFSREAGAATLARVLDDALIGAEALRTTPLITQIL